MKDWLLKALFHLASRNKPIEKTWVRGDLWRDHLFREKVSSVLFYVFGVDYENEQFRQLTVSFLKDNKKKKMAALYCGIPIVILDWYTEGNQGCVKFKYVYRHKQDK